MRTDLTTANAHRTTAERVRLGAVRTVLAGLVAGGAILALAPGASAKPPAPGIDIDDITVMTIPPSPPTTKKPPVVPPHWTIPPVLVDPWFPPTTVPPTVPPTIPPVIVDDPTVPPTVPPTIPPVIVNPTIPPTTVKPDPTPDPTPEPTPDPTVPPVDQPTTVPEPTVPVEVESATEQRPAADSLAVTGSSPLLPIAGLSLLGAGAVIAGGVAYDRRRRNA